MVLLIPIVPRADSGWYLVVPLMIAGAGLGPLVSQLNNYTLAPIEEERVSEAAGINSAGGSFGLSFGLAMAGGILLATLSLAFTNKTESSTAIRPAQQQQIADTLEHDAQVVSSSSRCSPTSAPPSAGKSSTSTTTRSSLPCRSPCSCRSSPAGSGPSTRSECCVYPISSRRAGSKVPSSAEANYRSSG